MIPTVPWDLRGQVLIMIVIAVTMLIPQSARQHIQMETDPQMER
jgi:hypothetical protein